MMISAHDYPWMIAGTNVSDRMANYVAAAGRLNVAAVGRRVRPGLVPDIDQYVGRSTQTRASPAGRSGPGSRSPGSRRSQAIRTRRTSKLVIEWMNDTSRPSRRSRGEAGLADFINAMKFANTVHDAKLRRILACEGACTLPPPATAVTAPGAGAAAPAPATADAPAAAPAAPGAVAPAPALTASARRTTLAAALRSGVALRVTLPGPGRLQASARHAGRRVARGARTRTGKVVARGATAAIAAGRRTVTLRFTATARRALRHARRATLNVKVSYRPARGTSLTRRLKLTLAR